MKLSLRSIMFNRLKAAAIEKVVNGRISRYGRLEVENFDPKTRSIVIYMESIGNARSFLSAAREVALFFPDLA